MAGTKFHPPIKTSKITSSHQKITDGSNFSPGKIAKWSGIGRYSTDKNDTLVVLIKILDKSNLISQYFDDPQELRWMCFYLDSPGDPILLKQSELNLVWHKTRRPLQNQMVAHQKKVQRLYPGYLCRATTLPRRRRYDTTIQRNNHITWYTRPTFHNPNHKTTCVMEQPILLTALFLNFLGFPFVKLFLTLFTGTWIIKNFVLN